MLGYDLTYWKIYTDNILTSIKSSRTDFVLKKLVLFHQNIQFTFKLDSNIASRNYILEIELHIRNKSILKIRKQEFICEMEFAGTNRIKKKNSEKPEKNV